MIDNTIHTAKTALEALSVYRGLLQDPVVSKLYTLLNAVPDAEKDFSCFLNLYNDFYHTLISTNSTCTFKAYVINRIIFDDNPFTKSVGEKDLQLVDACLRKAAESDLRKLQRLAALTARDIKEAASQGFIQGGFEAGIIEGLAEWDFDACGCTAVEGIYEILHGSEDWGGCLKALAGFHRENGSGMFARYKGFVWERHRGSGCLKGLEAPDPVRLSGLLGYELERSKVVENTLHFLKGYPANNMLLYGDRGTGKSSTVKALLNEYAALGLRMIEIPKKYLSDYPEIVRIIKDKPHKFIVFVDDLAFEDHEENYTALKAMLEGGLESKPVNVVIYATSNRRHLIKERFSDMADRGDEIRESETVQEKLSLADRFGIIVSFSSPSQQQYLKIVDGLAAGRGLEIDSEQLHREALKWEMWYNGRSPRTARQFVDWLEGKLKGAVSEVKPGAGW